MAGKLCQAVRRVTKQNQGGVLLPHDIDTKSGRPVMEVLSKKHPDAKEPLASNLPNLGSPPPMPPMVIGATVVKEDANQQSGVEGLSGLDFAMA